MRSIFCTAIILFAVIGVFAQEKILTRAEFDAVYKNRKWAPDSWKGRSYRMTTTNEVKTEGKPAPANALKITIEFAAPTVSRYVSEIGSGANVVKTESIRIGDKTYKRKGDEPWLVGTVGAGTKTETADAETAPADGDEEYKYLGAESLNGRTASVYATVTTTKPAGTLAAAEKPSVFTTKYWFAEDGTLLKKESVSERRSNGNTLYSRLTTVWELDPTIKVEAPVQQ
jgi:hypothetical protein